MHAPRAVQACTFFNDNVNDDVNDFVIDKRYRFRPCVRMASRFPKKFKYQPHLIAGEVA